MGKNGCVSPKMSFTTLWGNSMAKKPAKTTQPSTVDVKLAVDATIGRVDYKVGATVTVPVARKEIMMSHGIIVKGDQE